MALTNYKNNVSKPSDDEEYARLLCSVPGCGKRWTVKIDKPMCSFHQWNQPPKPTTNLADVLKPKDAQWYDNEQF